MSNHKLPREDIVTVLIRCADLIDSGQADIMNMNRVREAAAEIEHRLSEPGAAP